MQYVLKKNLNTKSEVFKKKIWKKLKFSCFLTHIFQNYTLKSFFPGLKAVYLKVKTQIYQNIGWPSNICEVSFL